MKSAKSSPWETHVLASTERTYILLRYCWLAVEIEAVQYPYPVWRTGRQERQYDEVCTGMRTMKDI